MIASLRNILTKVRKITPWRVRLRLEKLFPVRQRLLLRGIPGVIHVGANSGGERDEYVRQGLRVVWLEANPESYEILARNLAGYSDQRCIQCLVTDEDDREHDFYITSNDGLSSSMLPLKYHAEMSPDVHCVKTIRLKSKTLPSILRLNKIELDDYPALIMDTQGSELKILRGAAPVLAKFRLVQVEVADFEAYEGCCQLHDVDVFMTQHGFKEVSRIKFAETRRGSYYDVVYRPESPTRRSAASADGHHRVTRSR